MQDKKLRISVEDTKLKDLGRSATTLANDMIRSSRQYSTSSKEILRDLEEQIKLIEKRNKLDTEKQRTGLQTRFEAKEITGGQLRTGMSKIQSESREDKLQVQLLREVIDTIKATSKNEIREDRIGTEKRIRSDKSINKLGVTGDPQQALKNTIQQALLGELGQEESEQKGRFKAFGRFGKGAGRTFNTAAQLGTSKNELYALAGLVGLTPFVGQGLSQLGNRFLSAGETAEQSMTKMAVANMGSGIGSAADEWRSIKKTGLGIDLGLSPSELLSRRADIRQTMGFGLSEKNFMQSMGAEKFVGAGNIDQLASISRYGQGDMSKVIRLLEAGQENTTTLTENISAYVSASNNALNISSRVNEADMAKSIIGISTATGQTGIGLNQVTGAIQGLGKSNNPLTKSLMMRAFRQSNPNASMFDIQAMMEDPLANLQRGGGQFFDNIKEMSGGGQQYKQVLYSLFGGNISRTRINEILKDGGDFTQIAKEAQQAKEGGTEILRKAEDTTGVGARKTAIADAVFQDLGQKTLEASNNVIKSIEKLYDKLINPEDDKTLKEKTNEYLESLDKKMEQRLDQAEQFEQTRKAEGNILNWVPNPNSSMIPKQ